MAILDRAVWLQQHYFLLIAYNAQYEAFREEIGDLFHGEIDDGYHLFPDKFIWLVEHGDLSGGFADPDGRAKVDFELVSGISCFLENFCGEDGAHMYMHLFEIIPGNGFHDLKFEEWVE